MKLNIIRGKILLMSSCKSDHRKSLKLLKGDELEASGWGESRPNWEETLVETTWSLSLENMHEA